MIEVVATADEFIAAPLGHALIGRTWIYAGAHERLHVCTIWGELSADDLQHLIVILVAMLDEAVPRHATLVDLSHVQMAHENAFEALMGYIAKNRPRLETQIERVAIVPPAGLFGATARGFFETIEPPYEVKVLPVAEALAWLGEDPKLLDALDHVRAIASGPQIVRDLGALLNAQLGALTLPTAARALGLSARALQRVLQETGTTFRAEQHAHQMRAAEQLLLKDLSISQIAYAIGCASPAHFSVLFRKWTGQTPTRWRADRASQNS